MAGALHDVQGPVAFKDAVAADQAIADPAHHAEHNALISGLPARISYNVPVRYYQGFWMMERWARGFMAMQRSFVARDDDIVLASVPKSGTTWLKALAFATMARDRCPPSNMDHPLRRLNPHDCVPFIEGMFTLGLEAHMNQLPSPRLLATHMPLSLLPSSIASSAGCKIVYIYRDEKDRAVSLWHFVKHVQPDLSFSEVYESICNGTCVCGPVWDHILEYWKASNVNPNGVLFLKYENVLQDPCNSVRMLADFLGVPFSVAEEEVGVLTDIVDLCRLDNLRNLKDKKESSQGLTVKFSHDSFFRKGMAGDWVNHMTPEMAERLDAILREKHKENGFTV
uniref:Sulfotransferase n=1 Tax=Oryza punctata TaxID=4537 RepID=A0A0E0LTH0_ORYPU